MCPCHFRVRDRTAGAALGQSYPAKLIRIVNPVAPGGNQDTIARPSRIRYPQLGQQVVIESRPSSSAVVGTRYVRAAARTATPCLRFRTRSQGSRRSCGARATTRSKTLQPISLTGDVPLVLVGESGVAREDREGTNRARQAQARRADERLVRCRLDRACRDRNVQPPGGHPHAARSVQGRRAGRRRPRRRPCDAGFDQVTTSLPHIRAGKLRALARQHAANVRPRCPTCRRSRRPACPGFHDSTFNGCWRRPARRARSRARAR